MVRIALFASVIAIAVAPARAADAPKAKAPEPGTSVEMPYLIAPVIVDGKLVSNAYVSNKVLATSQAAAVDIREKTPFIQDAFVRDVNAKAIGKQADPATVDQPALQGRLLADARRIVGAGKVAGLTIIQIQVVPVRPDAAPEARPIRSPRQWFAPLRCEAGFGMFRRHSARTLAAARKGG